jgi:hypothetical protein
LVACITLPAPLPHLTKRVRNIKRKY